MDDAGFWMGEHILQGPGLPSCSLLHPGQNFHYRMLGLGAHYKPSEPYDFVVPCDVVQKQIVAVEFCKAIRSNQKNRNSNL